MAEPERWNPHNLAIATGLSYTTVWGIWANRSRRADLLTMEKLSAILKIEPGDLVGRADPEQSSDEQ